MGKVLNIANTRIDHHRNGSNLVVRQVLCSPHAHGLRHPDLPPDTQGTMSMGEEME
jgi:hypothetical protein